MGNAKTSIEKKKSMDRKNSQNSRRTVGSVQTYQQSLTSAQMARPTVQFSPPPNNTVVPPAYSSGYNSVPNTGYSMPPNSRPYTKSGYNSKASSRRSNRDNFICFDTRYAKSRQGIFKIVQWIISFIAWICIACTPYMKRIFVSGVTWPFHFVVFFTIMGWLCVSILYILFTSGYHRRRKRKPWPSYELYFNATMIFWFFTAVMIESFNLWRWNYGPYKEPVNHAGHSAPSTMYGGAVSSNNQHYYQGWDPKLYCRQRPQECHDYMNAVIYYNPYYPTHIFATI